MSALEVPAPMCHRQDQDEEFAIVDLVGHARVAGRDPPPTGTADEAGGGWRARILRGQFGHRGDPLSRRVGKTGSCSVRTRSMVAAGRLRAPALVIDPVAGVVPVSSPHREWTEWHRWATPAGARHRTACSPAWEFSRAGDGNRTRVLSLGSAREPKLREGEIGECPGQTA